MASHDLSPNVSGPLASMFSEEARAAIIAEELAEQTQHAADIEQTRISAAPAAAAAATAEAEAAATATSTASADYWVQ